MTPVDQTADSVESGRDEADTPEHPRWICWRFPEELDTLLHDALEIGRSPGSGISLAGVEISKAHATISLSEGHVSVIDSRSRNGTFVNGKRVHQCSLHEADVIRCGEWVGILTRHAGGRLEELAPDWLAGHQLAAAVAPLRRHGSSRPAIVQGESGTGKEGLARAIHLWSTRSKGPLVAVNCANLTAPSTAAAELFGVASKAFTGVAASEGHVRQAHKGTLFLDEVVCLPLSIQAQLLRVLQEGEVQPVGASQPVKVDVRVVVATQSALEDEVQHGRFRGDLLQRLRALTVVLPPLRTRREDIVPLARHFMQSVTGGVRPDLRPGLAEALCIYAWPYNVRELQQEVITLVEQHGHTGRLHRSMLPSRIRTALDDRNASLAPPSPIELDVAGKRQRVNDPAQYEQLVVALSEHGSVATAAHQLGIHPSRAYRLLKEFDPQGSYKR